MTGSRTLRADARAWERLQEEARAGAPEGVAGILADHLSARVRASLVVASGDKSVRLRLTMVGEQIVLVARRMVRVPGPDGEETRIEPGAQVTFTGPDELWPSIAQTFPETPLLRTPAPQTPNVPDQRLDLSPDEMTALLEAETANLRVQVEAWPEPSGDRDGADQPDRVWARSWSVVRERLLDVRSEDGRPVLVERPAGSVAVELRWALVGAVALAAPGVAAGSVTTADRGA